jgi:uncharacterized membrane protein
VFRSAFALVTASAIVSVASAQATFTPLGMPAGSTGSSATGVSANGAVVVGIADNSAWRWTPSDGIIPIPNLPGTSASQGVAVSDDGSTVVGSFSGNGNDYAFRWTAETGTVGILPITPAVASGTSANGAIVAGNSDSGAFRWTTTEGVTYLGTLAGGITSGAEAISADGSTVVGFSLNQYEVPIRWTEATGMVELPLLPGLTNQNAWGTASATNADGTVVAGSIEDLRTHILQAFRWSAQTGTVPISFSQVTGISADGSTMVGHSLNAALWTLAGGAMDLTSVLVANGATGLDGWTLAWANGISSDGHSIVGYGTHPSGETEAWLAHLPTFAPGDVNLDGIVNGQDIAIVASHWLTAGVGTPGDANGDGIMNAQDIEVIASNWLQTSSDTSSASAAPEPSTFALVALGALVVLARRIWRGWPILPVFTGPTWGTWSAASGMSMAASLPALPVVARCRNQRRRPTSWLGRSVEPKQPRQLAHFGLQVISRRSL